ncbi:restriction endonuclease subunit S [Vibrio metschnikovii]|nr:restriction endonuclease subunit S [Vibrio metschnikovii]
MENLALMPKYEAYKDSQVQWIGDIPANWYLEKAKWLFYKADRKPLVDDDIVTCFRDGQVTLRKNRRTEGFTNALKEHGYQRICKGDLVIHAMDAFAGAIGVSDSDGKSTPVYAACVPRKKGEVNSYYYAYYMRDLALSGFIVSLAKGIRERSTDFRFNDFAELLLPFPDYEEQIRIANFLDKKTAQIDDAIAIKEQQISLLKERKQIIIQQSVTQGLDPNVPMKDTGVDWIGKIPAHWATVTVKHLADVRDGTHDTPLYVEETNKSRYLITSKDFDGKSINFSNAKSISIKDHFEISKRSKVETGDVLMSMIGGNIGKSLIVEGFSDFSIKNVALFKTNGDLTLSRFIQYYLVSGLLEKLLAIKSRGGAQPFLSLTDIRNLILFKLPADEMNKIVDYLDSETAAHEAAISIQYQQIEKLKEYKTTLINSAVTGKIKITPEMVEQ